MPKRERFRHRFHALVGGLTGAWALVGKAGIALFLIFLFVVAPIIKFLVPGGSDWLHESIDTVLLLCMAPVVLGFLGGGRAPLLTRARPLAPGAQLARG